MVTLSSKITSATAKRIGIFSKISKNLSNLNFCVDIVSSLVKKVRNYTRLVLTLMASRTWSRAAVMADNSKVRTKQGHWYDWNLCTILSLHKLELDNKQCLRQLPSALAIHLFKFHLMLLAHLLNNPLITPLITPDLLVAKFIEGCFYVLLFWIAFFILAS